MEIKHLKKEEAMGFTDGHIWHLDIWLEPNAQITSVSLHTFSKVYPSYIYNIIWNLVVQLDGRTQIPIDVAKVNYSNRDEAVHLHYDITYVLL